LKPHGLLTPPNHNSNGGLSAKEFLEAARQKSIRLGQIEPGSAKPLTDTEVRRMKEQQKRQKGRASQKARLTVTGCRFLREVNTQEIPHTERALLDHLLGTRQLLVEWGARPAVCDAGLFHSDAQSNRCGRLGVHLNSDATSGRGCYGLRKATPGRRANEPPRTGQVRD